MQEQGTGAPAAAKYITQTIDGGLSDEQSLGLLTTGLVLNTVTAGTGVLSAYAGAAAVTNQFLSSLNASGVATHRAIVAADISNGLITDTMVATANKDGVAGTASMRTLGSGAQTAAAGNDGRFPTAGRKQPSREARGLRVAETSISPRITCWGSFTGLGCHSISSLYS